VLPSAFVPESADLVEALLAADPAERLSMLGAAAPADVAGVIPLLGHRHDVAAAEVLTLIDSVAADRAVRKAARRELHRLESIGIHPSTALAAMPSASGAPREAPLAVSEAWATDIDPSGARALWLLAERPLGGVWFAALLLSDLEGLLEVNLVDTTRKRFLRELADRRRETSGGTWISMPGDYAWHLVREAVDVTGERGASLPTRYRALRDVIGEADGPPERALVYETVSPVEASFNPELLEQSAQLLREPETRGWYVPLPESLRARALEVARAPASTLLVPGQAPEQQALQLLAEAARLGLTPPVLRALRRRLEETAYLFVTSDRLLAARRAVAAARALEDTNRPVERHPFLRMLLGAGLARLVRSERIGTHSAAEVLVELIERAAEQHQREGGAAIESRPSGLILPR
jgi:hypothetical protein